MSQHAEQPINSDSVKTLTYWRRNTTNNSASTAEEAQQEEVVQQQTKRSKKKNNKPSEVDGDNFILHHE
jgi:hypothetical protein